jgi:hypothetical protein
VTATVEKRDVSICKECPVLYAQHEMSQCLG